jgi:adenylosuccinate synthase
MAKVSIVVGMQYGDEGKGMSVNRLFSSKIISSYHDKPILKPSLVVRYNGSSQAAHNVTSKDGIHHTFHQIGSGYLSRPHITYLHSTFFVDPWALINEAELLNKKVASGDWALENVVVHNSAPILLPIYGYINRLEEIARGVNAHGSCGKGVGVLAKDIEQGNPILRHNITSVLKYPLTQVVNCQRDFVKYLLKKIPTDFDQKELAELYRDYNYYFNGDFVEEYASWLENVYFSQVNIAGVGWLNWYLKNDSKHIVFEGAQGILLDEWHGFHPHTTWSSTNLRIPHEILRSINYDGEYHTYGVVKAFGSRHGAGPFPGEDSDFENDELIDAHNTYGRWQGGFRIGAFDSVALRYALRKAKDSDSNYRGIDSFQLTCLDVIRDRFGYAPVVSSYDSGEIKANLNMFDLTEQEKTTKELFQTGVTIDKYPVNIFDIAVPGIASPIPISHRSYSARDTGEEVIYADYMA